MVTGIGHETDFTIAEFVADQRAATPTAAAELAAPARSEMLAELRRLGQSLRRQMQFALDAKAQRVDSLAGRLQNPADRLAANGARLELARARLGAAFARATRDAEWRLSHAARRLVAARPNLQLVRRGIAQLEDALRHATARRLDRLHEALARLSLGLGHLDPGAVLERGYAIARRPDGSVVRTSAGLKANDLLELSFARGAASVRVEKPH